MSDFVDALKTRIWAEQQRWLNIKREKIFVGLDLSCGKREELIEELKRYRYEDRKSRPSGEIQRET